ncbi:S-formylglutathione hydrolase isoform X1 [Drosophila pseudoobscura]|uniref:S-formylglutathione hydrolase n=2 Tax=Drosophila pseudoobscura pseudoobscura TaxID=46245 RepID=A0A6I8V3J2_DROPS|nr:S-formylglutathione hydrolase isoform X1 [Drosophila pseudoobscura]
MSKKPRLKRPANSPSFRLPSISGRSSFVFLFNPPKKTLGVLSFGHIITANMMLELISSVKCFEGEQRVYQHSSKTLDCDMTFGVFLPAAALEDKTPCPVLFFLSGLTCTHENFIQKSGFQKYAAQHGLIVVNPDTSPRGIKLEGQDDAYDFGSGAGFYVDAKQEPWSKHYKMYSYVTEELVELVNANLPVAAGKRGIFGHSMGGHGALICALKNPGLYKSVSAFAPIANPSEGAWGQKALTGYIGANKADWDQWDATRLVSQYESTPQELFIDQGLADNFLAAKQLLPENLLAAADSNEHIQTIYKQREGYDHGYFYISTFVGEHIAYHANLLKATKV